MSKTVKKLLSFILAACVIFSCMIPVFATGVTYEANYTKRAPKRMYAETLQDANELIANKAFNGKAVQDLYIKAASMSGLIPEVSTVAFYTKAEEKIFKNLSGFVKEGEAVTPELLARYFAEYPVVIIDADDFTLKVNNLIDAIITPGLMKTRYTVLFLGAVMTPEIGYNGHKEFYGNIDEICDALGIKQEMKFIDALTYRGSDRNVKMATYIKNIVNAVIPDVTNNVLGIAKNLADDKNNIVLYVALTDFSTKLHCLVVHFEPMLTKLLQGVDVKALIKTFGDVKDTINTLPTTMKGNDKMFDYQECVAHLVNDILGSKIMNKLPTDVQKLIPQNAKLIRFKRDNWNKLCLLRLDDFNLANIKYAEDEVDVFNVLYHYVYKNVNRTSNKLLLYPTFKLLPLVAPEAPKNIVSYANFMLTQAEDNSAYKLYKDLHIAMGHKLIFLCDAAAGEYFYEVGQRITIEAPEAPEGKMFDRWEVVTGNVKLDNPNLPHTSFIMPEHDVEIVPVYKDIEYTAVIDDTVRTFVMGDVISLKAEDWKVVDGDVDLVNGMNNEVLFVMPNEDVKVADEKNSRDTDTEATKDQETKANVPESEKAPEAETKAPALQADHAESTDKLEVPNTGSALTVFPAMAAIAFAGLAFAAAKAKKKED